MKSITTFDGELDHAVSGNSVTVTLEDEIDLSRGDLLAGETGLPQSATSVRATLVWLHSDPCRPEKPYLVKHGARIVRGRISTILHRLDVNTLRHLPEPAPEIHMNEIVAAQIETTLPLFFDPYSHDRVMGSFILIDPITNATVAAGMIEDKAESAQRRAGDSRRHSLRNERMRRNGHPAAALWIANRPELADRIERVLFDRGWLAQTVLNTDVPEAALESVAATLHRVGAIAIFSLTEDAPHLRSRSAEIFGEGYFFAIDEPAASDSEASEAILRWLDELPSTSAHRDHLQEDGL